VPISRATTSSGVRSVPTKLIPVVVSATDPTVIPGLDDAPPEPAAYAPVSAPENDATVEAPAPPPLPHALAELTDVPDLVLTERDQGVLDRLLGKMQRKGDFPAFMKNVTEINVKANITSDVSATQLGELILRDYALTSKLLRVVNSTSYERLGKRVNKVSRAVVVLGFDKVRSTALAISLHKNHGPRAHAPELAELSINALVSGEIARTLARDAGLADSEETQVCAMFRNVGLQLLVHYMPEEFGRAKEAAAEQAISLDQAVTQIVGISARKLGLGVMQRWRMSPRVFSSMQPPSTHTKPRTDDDKLRVLSAFANDLTSVVSTVPEEDLPRALEALLGRYRVGLPMSVEKLNALLGTVQKAFNERYATLLDLDPSKSAFCQKASRITGLLPDGSSPHAADADGGHVVTRSSADQRLDAIELVLQGEHHPGEVLRSVLEAFALEFGMRRAMLLTLGSDRTSLTVQCAWGEDGRSLEEELVFPLGGMHSGDLLANAHHLQRDVVVPDAFDAKVTAKMPRPYYEVLGSKAFVALPCGGKGTPVRVLLADGDTPETLPGPAHAATVARFRELIGRKGLNPSGLLDVLRRPVGRRPMGR
jgi:HD-like signal output (HDOD) protein